jgi:hypothetical protein
MRSAASLQPQRTPTEENDMNPPHLVHLARARSLALLSAGLAVLASCGGSDGMSGPTADLSGTVSEATKTTPIAGAIVVVGSRATTTAADGAYQLLGIPVGEATLTVTAPGYEVFAQTVSVEAGANQRDVPMAVKTFYEFGQYGAYIPPFTETLRGIVVLIGGFDGGWLSVVRGSEYPPSFPQAAALHAALRAFAQEQGFAVLGEAVPREAVPDGPALVRPALSSLAGAVSHHPELQQAPVLLLGGSWGGCRAYEYVGAEGPRVIGFITVKGGCHPVTSQPLAHPVPGYLFIGGDDTFARIENLTTAFEVNRSAGALWALAVEQGAGHTFPADLGLMFEWMAAVVSLRLPESVTPGEPVVLRTIDEEGGWLGDRGTFAICGFDCYSGDPGDAAWLPSAETATQWATFVSATPTGPPALRHGGD